MKTILDLKRALQAGSQLPTGGILRRQPCKVVRRDKRRGWTVIKFVDTIPQYADQEFIVPDSCLTQTESPPYINTETIKTYRQLLEALQCFDDEQLERPIMVEDSDEHNCFPGELRICNDDHFCLDDYHPVIYV